MTIFWEGAETLPINGEPNTRDFRGKIGALLSANYRRVFQHFASTEKELPEVYHRLQLVTDYVCGMTDSFAKRLHAELKNG
jgi:dGTPase